MKRIILQWINRLQQIKEENLQLKRATFVDTPTYSLKGLRTLCKPLKIYDGDTLWIAFIFDHKLRKVKVRMSGYDSAEMRSHQPEQVKIENEAREKLIELLGKDLVEVEFYDNDKYGRPLVKIYMNKCCINDKMIESGYGKPYDGGKKTEW
jgi:endonuclease YncB( thermonuclease family)